MPHLASLIDVYLEAVISGYISHDPFGFIFFRERGKHSLFEIKEEGKNVRNLFLLFCDVRYYYIIWRLFIRC